MKDVARRAVVLAAASGAIVCLLLPQAGTLPLLLVYNASASAPRGVYLVLEPAPLRRGDLVLARLPPVWQAWAAGRGYLGHDVPVIKRIAALAGDHVCMLGRHLLVNERVRVLALERDSKARALPHWRGCRNLGPGEVLLVMDNVPGSFDGRYFGPLRINHILGRLHPLAVEPAPRRLLTASRISRAIARSSSPK